MQKRRNQLGITLIEVLIGITLVAVMATVFIFMSQMQLSKSRDAKRKTDLEKIKVAFEDYYNDNNCYPPAAILSTCGGDFSPYLRSIPCDPSTLQPYVYVPLANVCGGYRLLTQLENPTDSVAVEIGCATSCGCGLGAGYEQYTYGVSSGTELVGDTSACTSLVTGELTSPIPSTPASPAPSGSPAPPVYVYACDTNGVCNQYTDPGPAGCTTFPTVGLCNSACQTDPDTYACAAGGF